MCCKLHTYKDIGIGKCPHIIKKSKRYWPHLLSVHEIVPLHHTNKTTISDTCTFYWRKIYFTNSMHDHHLSPSLFDTDIPNMKVIYLINWLTAIWTFHREWNLPLPDSPLKGEHEKKKLSTSLIHCKASRGEKRILKSQSFSRPNKNKQKPSKDYHTRACCLNEVLVIGKGNEGFLELPEEEFESPRQVVYFLLPAQDGIVPLRYLQVQ